MKIVKCNEINAYQTEDSVYVIKRAKHRPVWEVWEKRNGFYEKNGMVKSTLAEAKNLILKMYY